MALATSHSSYSQDVGESLDLKGFLPGQFEVEGASGRPPARAYWLLYAAALDQYMNKNAALLSKEPVLTHLLKREFSIAQLGFTLPNPNSDKFPPVVDASREASDLEHFLATGYDGKLRKEIEASITELRRGAKTKVTVPPNRSATGVVCWEEVHLAPPGAVAELGALGTLRVPHVQKETPR